MQNSNKAAPNPVSPRLRPRYLRASHMNDPSSIRKKSGESRASVSEENILVQTETRIAKDSG